MNERPSALTGAVILIVEDDADLRHILAAVLTRAGAEVLEADSAEKALDKLQRVVPDLVLTDVSLGGGRSGMWLLDEIRLSRAVPVVALTGRVELGDLSPLGFADAIFKPVEPKALLARLTTVLERRRRTRRRGPGRKRLPPGRGTRVSST
ncbi:MAG TPA: response regulator [Terriglobales bacterium]|nr:response regulator [Terriglobales bacterium]